MTMLFDFIVLVFVLFCAYLGWEKGMWTAGVAALELLACIGLAVLVYEPIAGFLYSFVRDQFSQTWVILLVFASFAWGPFFFMRYRFHTTETVDLERLDIDPLSDRIGGVIAGGLGGAIFVGGVLITMSMTPFLARFKPSGDRLQLDVGKLVLQTVGHFLIERPEGYDGPPLPIHGGPVSPAGKKDTRALLTCEPFVNVDEDSAFSEEKDRYRDVDGDGSYTKDLYVTDVEGVGGRRIGLIDKYVAGCWDTELNVAVRKRTDVQKPDPRKGKKGKKGTGDDPANVKPVETDF